MSLVVATGPFCAAERATSLLQAIKVTHYDVLELPAEKSKIEQHLKADASNTVLFLYADMADVVSSVVRAGNQLPSNELIHSWQEGLLKVKRMLREYPTQSVLLECSAAQQYPIAFLQQYNTLTHSNLSDSDFSGLLKETDHLAHLLAEAWSKQYPGLLHTQQQLAALATPLTDKNNVTTVSAEAALLQVQAQFAEQQQLQQALNATQLHLTTALSEQQNAFEENEAVLQELHRVQEELERLHHVQQDTQCSLEQQKQDSQKLHSELEQTSQQLQRATTAEKEHKEEAELILTELHRVQEELERFHHQLETSQQAEQQSKTYAAQLEQHLKDALDNLEQKKTALDSTQKMLTQAQQQVEVSSRSEQESKEEAEFILAELHRVQEVLEQFYLQQQPPFNEQKSTANDEMTIAKTAPKNHKKTKIKGFLSQRRAKRKLEKKAQQLVESRLFKSEWYLNVYPDVASDAKASQNPALHYLQYGGFEGRNPGPEFNSSYYLGAYPDVAESGINPLWHYIQMGLQEGRRTKA